MNEHQFALVLDEMRSTVKRWLDPWGKRIEALGQRGPAKGDPGERGPSGGPGPKGDAGTAGERGEKGDPGKDGRDGRDGKSVTPEEVGALVKAEVALIPRPVDGVNGKDGSPGRDGEKGEPGKDGAPGADGKDGAPGRDGKDGSDGAPGKDGAPGERGPAGEKGDPGRDGRDVDPDTIKTLVVEAIKAIPAPKDGRDGKDGAPGKDGVNGKDGAPGINGKDADLESVRDFIRTEVDRQVKTIPPAQPGRDGRDGSPGQPGRPGIDGKDGMTPDDLDVSLTGRDLVIRLAAGDRVIEKSVRLDVPLYKDIYRSGQPYEKGDCVTYGGCMWIAKADTSTAPPGDDWRAWQ